ncbi:SDR family NAD(P)-dependent oxidoreductase [Streptacidiphilus sp. N1-12]|uniref:SDR family NAD(P)-dependent oxidoreductase n=2 Tax=Streptacidiphilus alkalitolerans TaxID=3342712 RepID=A0ABV6WPX3_9ACTN
MATDLDDPSRIVIVSGASSGIGEATARHFAAGGDHVVNLDVRPPAADAPGQWIEVDVADWSDVERAVAAVHDEHGRLDVVIANAGISLRHGVLDITEAQARRTLEVNLLGVLALWRAAAERMLPRRKGVLLATASVNGTRGYPLYADYNASKAGVASLCQTFGLELAPWIRTACVTPGAVLTPMQRAEYTDEMLAEVNACIPMRRHADPAEIAAMFHFLASDQARFITGQEFVVDGGETAGATTAFLALPDKPTPPRT